MSTPEPLDPDILALILSERVSAGTRAVLLARALPDDPAYRPVALTRSAFAVLRAAASRIVPQPDMSTLDIAARLDAALEAGDGWRFADLAPDAAAWEAGLGALEAASHAAHGIGFASLGAAAQDTLLGLLADGALSPGNGLDATQQKHWFEDFCADAARVYVSHPAIFSRIGYGGFACGGDGVRKQGFEALEPGAREAWELVAKQDRIT